MGRRQQQRGLSFFTVIFVVAVLAAVGVMAMQAVPSFLEYQAVVKAVNKAAGENSPQEVRNAFDRAAQVDNITSITGKDLEVTRNGDQQVVSFAYQREFHMAGPAWLTLKYAGSSRSR